MKPNKHSGLEQYSLDTLLKLEADYQLNPLSSQAGSDESERLAAIKKEITKRIKR
jgi:hypothetical protein